MRMIQAEPLLGTESVLNEQFHGLVERFASALANLGWSVVGMLRAPGSNPVSSPGQTQDPWPTPGE